MRKGLDVDPESRTELPPLRGEVEPLATRSQEAPLFEAVENAHAQFTREMVVADACLPERGLAGTRAKPYRAGAVRHLHEAFEKPGHIAIGESKVTMPPLALYGQQARIEQLGEMGADRLLCYAREFGEFRCGERLARHQGRKNLGPGVIADQRGNANDVRSIFHGSILVEPLWCRKGVSSDHV